jgi:hypothetical protein
MFTKRFTVDENPFKTRSIYKSDKGWDPEVSEIVEECERLWNVISASQNHSKG